MKLKRFLLVVLSVTAMLCMTLGLTACGEKEHTHTPGKTYERDATGHWLTCTDCGEALEKEAHTGNPCEVCEYTAQDETKDPTDDPKDPPGGQPQTHTHELERVGLKEPTCAVPGNEEYYACEGCGKFFSDSKGLKIIQENSWVIPATGKHKTDGVYHTDATYHWQTCTVCENAIYKTTHKSNTQEHNDTQHWSVCLCGEIVGEKESHAEDYDWGRDETNHWKVCRCGFEMSTKTAHKKVETDGDDEDLEPDSNGHKFRCEECGVVTIPHTKENYEEYEDPSNQFLFKSLHHYTCSVCDYRGLENHRYDDDVVFVTDKDYHKYTCIDCGVASEGSHFYNIVMDNATNHRKICNTCGYEVLEEHSYGQYDYKTDDTYHWQVCGICGYEKSDEKTAHTDTHGWYWNETHHYKYCSVCSTTYIPQTEHTIGTLHTDGLYHWYDCTVCNAQTSKTYHTFVGANGTNKTCSDCNYTLTASVGLKIENGVLLGIGTCKDTVIVIPEGVTSIAPKAFYLDKTITGLIIPSSVTSIGESAFDQCSNIETMIMGSGVTSIGEKAFSNAHIQNFYFEGTKAQLKAITKGENWFGNVIDIHCSDGDINYRDL